MRHGAKAIAVLALALAACGGRKQDERAGGEAVSAEAAALPARKPPPAFAQCMSCHSVEPGRTMIGPSLHGIIGRRAASLPGYAYSNALKGSGLTWDEATLDRWLTDPAKLVPGSRMIFTGLPDPARRRAVIAYLKAGQ
ncbi:MAG: c-type cytochrome [Novosphingobium sp.]|jgi:cytochrome c|nr:c-type cytochrome [Novosphingobium sp.]